MNMKQRIKSKTPPFWKKVQKIGIAATAIGGALANSPYTLHPSLTIIGGYLATAGAITSVLSQLAVHEEPIDITKTDV